MIRSASSAWLRHDLREVVHVLTFTIFCKSRSNFLFQFVFLEDNPDRAAEVLAKIPLQRMGDPEADIGRAAVFLASDDAAYMTGQTLWVDGGQVIRS